MKRLAALLAVLLVLSGCSTRSDTKTAVSGVLDLRQWDFRAEPRVALNGDWVFAPGDLTTPGRTLAEQPPGFRRVPDLWSDREAGGTRGFGAATYHVTVLLPDSAPRLALRYTSASSAFRVEVGTPLVEVGLPSLDPNQAKAAYRPGTVRLPVTQGRLELTVRVSNYVYRVGGLWFPLELGTVDAVETGWLADVALALGHSVALATIGVILLVLFFLRTSDRAFIFSALLAAALALRGLVTGDYLLTRFWPDIPFDLLIRLEYLTVYLCFPVAFELFPALVPGSVNRKLLWVLKAISWAFVVEALVLPLDLLTRWIFVFYGFAFVAVAGIVSLLTIDAVQKKGHNSRMLLGGAIVLAAAIFNDVLFSSFFVSTTNLGTWGFLFFILVLVWIIFERFTLAFSEVENLVSQKDMLILEIQHRVRNNLQLMAGLISLQAKRMSVPEAKDALTGLRSRVVTMGLVHEKLYGKVKETRLDLGDYLSELVALLAPPDAVTGVTVKTTMAMEPRERPADLCLNVGLILAELVNNSWKHTLLERSGGCLTVGVEGDDRQLVLVVEDDGPGFPPGFRPDPHKSLGFRLIESLTTRYRGGWEILPGPGGRVKVTLKLR